MTQEELMAMMSGPTYDSTGADDDDKTLSELRAQRGDGRLEPVKAADPEPEKDPEPAKEPEVKEPEKDPEPKKEAEPEKEPEPKKEAEPEKEPEPKEHMIPKSRYDSLRARMDQLEEQLKTKQPVNTTPAVDPIQAIDEQLAAIDEPMSKALADGDMVKYRELRTQERGLYSQRAEAIAERKASSVTTASLDEQNFLRGVDLLETNFPALNVKSESFNEGLTNQVTELVEAYIAMGHSKTESLKKAVNVMEGQIRATLPAAKAKDPEPVKDPEPDPAIAAQKEADRKAAAVKKAVEASKAQPAATAKTGQDADKQGIKNGVPNPNAMTDEELDALPAETLKRMRGDFRAGARA